MKKLYIGFEYENLDGNRFISNPSVQRSECNSFFSDLEIPLFLDCRQRDSKSKESTSTLI